MLIPVGQRVEALATRIRNRLHAVTLAEWDELEEAAKAAREAAIREQNEEAANRSWYLRRVIEGRRTFLTSVEQAGAGKYYEAWCGFEQVEIGLLSLKRNPFYDLKVFGVKELSRLVSGWQNVYPYAVFFSPEFIVTREECSICGLTMTPWSGCKHEKGKVYSGQECVRIVQEAELLSVSLVRDPVQKYSVAHITTIDGVTADRHDYSMLEFMIERITSPFDGWDAEWRHALHPHEMFPDIEPTGPCPCESGRTYQACCLERPGVLRPHLQILFDRPPPATLPSITFTGYKERNGPAVATASDEDAVTPQLLRKKPDTSG